MFWSNFLEKFLTVLPFHAGNCFYWKVWRIGEGFIKEYQIWKAFKNGPFFIFFVQNFPKSHAKRKLNSSFYLTNLEPSEILGMAAGLNPESQKSLKI